MAIAKMMGSGWHNQSLRHSNARRFGRAGGNYIKQLEMGRKIEKEHEQTIQYLKKHPRLTLKQATTKIAKDHLRENPNYYTDLAKAEKTLGRKFGKSLRKFVENNREEIDEVIKSKVPNAKINDQERELWVMNEEHLYRLARSEGVNV